MRIGIYDPYLDDGGGGEKYMMTIAMCLSSNHHVTVFGNKREDMDAVAKRFSLNLKNVTFAKNIFSPQVSFLQRAIATSKYDAFIILSDGSIPTVFSRKLFLHIQQPLSIASNLSLKNTLKRMRITNIFYNSQFTFSFNKHFFNSVPQSVIYPPVTIKAKIVTKENIVMHVGRFRTKNIEIDDYKKQFIMVEAYKKLVDSGVKNWRFVLAASVKPSDEKKFADLQERAKGYPIVFKINKTNDELWELYSKAKIYWHASGYGENLKTHPEYAEHFGISTVEAMGAGAVPVVLNAGGQTEIVTDGENGFLWNSLEELEAKTKELMDNRPLLKRFSEAARKRGNQFSEKRFCEEIQNLVK